MVETRYFNRSPKYWTVDDKAAQILSSATLSNGVWKQVGEIPLRLCSKSSHNIVAYMRDNGFQSTLLKGKVRIENDGYTITIYNKHRSKGLFAIPYGNVL